MEKEKVNKLLKSVDKSLLEKEIYEGLDILKKCKKNSKCHKCNENHKEKVDNFIKKIRKEYAELEIGYCIEQKKYYNINETNCKELREKIELLKIIYRLTNK